VTREQVFVLVIVGEVFLVGLLIGIKL